MMLSFLTHIFRLRDNATAGILPAEMPLLGEEPTVRLTNQSVGMNRGTPASYIDRSPSELYLSRLHSFLRLRF